MKHAILSPLGLRSFANRDIRADAVLEVLTEKKPCTCGHEELDPGSYHPPGCLSLYVDVKLPTSEVRRMNLTHLTFVKAATASA